MAFPSLRTLLPLPALDGERNLIRDAWRLLAGVPGGRVVFSRLVGRMAPYTGSIGAVVTVLREGHAEVTMEDRPGLRNHLRSVHAIALANLAELTGNVALAYSLPDDARFIVAGMSVEYLRKARGTITGVSECPVPPSSARAEYEVPVSLRDATGAEVARATLRTLVGPKPGAAAAAQVN
ncbi:MAG: hotdog fold domain-containing protein [Kofleriaceae bacterium]